MDCMCQSQESSNEKRVALITGSSTGIGANIALDLAAANYRVIVIGRNLDKLTQVAEKCNKAAANDSNAATVFKVDLMDLKQIDKLVEFIRIKFKQLDVLVNNACWRGDNVSDVLADGAYDEMKRVMHLNVLVPAYLINKCLMTQNVMGQANKPVVINISSIASRQVVPLHLYSISKACLSQLSARLAKMSQSLLSVTISPGPVLTDERPHHQQMRNLTLLGRVGTTQEISNLVSYAIENAQMLNGQEITVDGGYMAKQKQVQ